MSFFNTISDWFNKNIIQVFYNPAADELSQLYRNNIANNLSSLQKTVSSFGGGLGSAILTIPGIGKPIVNAFNALQQESSKLLNDAKSMTPDQIAAANDALKQRYQDLSDCAKENPAAPSGNCADIKGKNGGSLTPQKTELEEVEMNVSNFFKGIFHNTLYICIFVGVIILAFVGSSLAANNAFGKPNAILIYYMIYGFLLFPIPIITAIIKYFNNTFKSYALWAPLHKGYSKNALFDFFFSYPADYDTRPSHFTKTSLALSSLPSLPSYPTQGTSV